QTRRTNRSRPASREIRTARITGAARPTRRRPTPRSRLAKRAIPTPRTTSRRVRSLRKPRQRLAGEEAKLGQPRLPARFAVERQPQQRLGAPDIKATGPRRPEGFVTQARHAVNGALLILTGFFALDLCSLPQPVRKLGRPRPLHHLQRDRLRPRAQG